MRDLDRCIACASIARAGLSGRCTNGSVTWALSPARGVASGYCRTCWDLLSKLPGSEVLQSREVSREEALVWEVLDS